MQTGLPILFGAIPASLGKLKNLIALNLSMNGSIPIEIFTLSLLSKYLDLLYNSFIIRGPFFLKSVA